MSYILLKRNVTLNRDEAAGKTKLLSVMDKKTIIHVLYRAAGGEIMVRTKQDVERLEAELNRIYESIDMNSEELFNNRIKGIWQRLKTSSGNEQLKTMPLAAMLTVNKELPVNTLTNNGLKTMKDLADKTSRDLAQLDGMDEKRQSTFIVQFLK